MKELLNDNTLFVEVVMARQGSKALVLVVEGKDEEFLLKKHLDREQVTLVAGQGGKQNILKVATRVSADPLIDGVGFLIDSDYDRVIDPAITYPNTVFTSSRHDAVIDVLATNWPLIEQVIEAHSRKKSVSGASVRLKALALASELSVLRVLNDRLDLSLNLQNFPFGELPDPATSDSIARIALARSGLVSYDTEMLTAKMKEEAERIKHIDKEHLVGDHDYFKALASVLKLEGITPGFENLVSSFLALVSCRHVSAADWYTHIDTWAQENDTQPFLCPSCETTS